MYENYKDFQVKDVRLCDLRPLGRKHATDYAIFGTGLSASHMHKVMAELCKTVKELQVKELSGLHIIGRDDDPWMILLILEVGVHLMVKQFREASGVEDMITTSPDVVEDLESMSQSFNAKARHEYKMKKHDIDNFVQKHLNDDDNKIN